MTDEWQWPDDSVYIGTPNTHDGWVMLVAAEVFRHHGEKGYEAIARKLDRFTAEGNEKGIQTFREVAGQYHRMLIPTPDKPN